MIPQLQDLQSLETLELYAHDFRGTCKPSVELFPSTLMHTPVLKHLDLSWTGMNGDKLTIFINCMSAMSSLLRLDLAGNRIDDTLFIQLIQCFRHMPLLQSLDLWRNHIGLSGLGRFVAELHQLPQLQFSGPRLEFI